MEKIDRVVVDRSILSFGVWRIPKVGSSQVQPARRPHPMSAASARKFRIIYPSTCWRPGAIVARQGEQRLGKGG